METAIEEGRSYSLKEVFTPSRPARVTFVERKKLNDRVIRALDTPGTQLVVYGHTGSGKSTLIENLVYRVYEKQINTNCMEGMTFDQVVLDAFDQLGEFYVDEVTNHKKSTVNATLKGKYLAIEAQMKAAIEKTNGLKEKRLIPPQLTPQALGRFLGEAGYCWILEDFHKIIGKEKKKLAQMMKVFVNLADKHEDLTVVALGAVNTAREVVKYDKEMRRRTSEIHVDLMDDKEIKEIIKKGCKALNIVIDNKLALEIVHHSNGLASICHKLCFLMCEAALIRKTLPAEPEAFKIEDLKDALMEYTKESEDTIKDAFDLALTISGVEKSIRVLCSQSQEGAQLDELFNYAKENSIRQTKIKLESDLKELEKEKHGELVKFDETSQRYSFSDPFYRTFALAYFEVKDERGRKAMARKSQDEKIKDLNQAFLAFANQIKEID